VRRSGKSADMRCHNLHGAGDRFRTDDLVLGKHRV
jgi:hypothetical protein